jgi:hypothetical protein
VREVGRLLGRLFGKRPGEESNARDVFVSCHPHDRALGERLQRTLQAHGVTTASERDDSPPGAEWGEDLTGRIIASRSLALVLTPSYAASQEALRELDVAVKHGKPIFVLEHVAVEPEALPISRRQAAWLSFSDEADVDQSVIALVRQVRSLTERES